VNTPRKDPRIRVEPGFEETWPGSSAVATECLVNLGFLGSHMANLGEALARRHGLPSLAAFDALATIDREGGPLPPSAVAERMVISRPTITGVVRSLEQRGLVRRLSHPRDRRMHLLALTAKGRTVVRRVRALIHQGERHWMGALTEGEQHTFLRMLAKLQANAPDPRQPTSHLDKS
jgi:DNA-binding MarR family transcriptional regulator